MVASPFRDPRFNLRLAHVVFRIDEVKSGVKRNSGHGLEPILESRGVACGVPKPATVRCISPRPGDRWGLRMDHLVGEGGCCFIKDFGCRRHGGRSDVKERDLSVGT